MVSCNGLPGATVWLKKIDFESDPNANGGTPFVCHVVIANSQDLCGKLRGMNSKVYFSKLTSLEKSYRDSLEIIKYDIIPGKNKLDQKITPKSYLKARGAFLFVKYLNPGDFTEEIGAFRNVVIRFLPHGIEVHPDLNLDELTSKLNL
ncbi:MAG: hypothetical protein LBI95_00040 [Holosporales bacterium]|nr:hypothetical protein [Holosporales bacterium]